MAKTPSGKFVIRVGSDLHGSLLDIGDERGWSLNSTCLHLIQRGMERDSDTHPSSFGVDRIIEWWGEQIVGVVLFGSEARNEAGPGSDIDLLLVLPCNQVVSRELYRDWDRMLQEHPYIPRRVSPHFSAIPSDPSGAGSLWLEVAIDGKLIWDKTDQVSSMMQEIRLFIASGAAKRSTIHGHGYWTVEDPYAK